MGVRAAAFEAGKINIGDLTTCAVPHDGINDAFEPMRNGAAIRSVVVY